MNFGNVFFCPGCEKTISKKKRRRHKTRCGKKGGPGPTFKPWSRSRPGPSPLENLRNIISLRRGPPRTIIGPTFKEPEIPEALE